jgi:hypothetical protein
MSSGKVEINLYDNYKKKKLHLFLPLMLKNWFYMKYIVKYLIVQKLLTCECTS